MPFILANWKYIVIAVMLAAAFLSGWVRGNAHGTQKLVDYVQEQAQEATRIAQVRSKVTEKVITRYLEKKGATERVTEFIDREVVKYAETNTGMCIDAEFVRLHNNAAANELPKPTPKPSGTLRTTEAPYWHRLSIANIGYGNSQLRGSPSLR